MNTLFRYTPTQTTPFPLKVKLKSHIWQLINKTIFRIFPLQFKWYRILLLRMFGANLADSVTISPLARIDHPWNLSMGHLSSLGEGSWAYCLAPINIKNKCCVGKDVFLITGSHDISDLNFNMITKPININDGCWIATGAYILSGVTLGEYTVVGAMSVVTKNTNSFDVVAGNPAKFIKKRIFIE